MATIPSTKNAHSHGDRCEVGEEVAASMRDAVLTVTVIVEAVVELND